MSTSWLAPTAGLRRPRRRRHGGGRYDGVRRVMRELYRRAARHMWMLLAVETAVVALAHADETERSWHFFRTGALLLTHPSVPGGGLHLYHANPELQIGPLTFLVAWPFAALPQTIGEVLAMVFMCLLGLVILRLAGGLVKGSAARRRRVILPAGILFVPVWSELAVRSGHLDDALALLAAVAALRVARDRPVTSAVLLGLAAGFKPWAVVFVPLILVAEGDRGRAAAVWLAVVALPWLPFLLADPGTVAVTHFTIPNVADSSLRFLGVHAAATPWWCRPAQALLGIAVAAVAVRRGRPHHVLLAGIAARVLLDPETYPYYTAGLLVGTVVADVTMRRRIPYFSLSAVVFLFIPAYVHVGPLADPAVSGGLRAAFCIGALVAVAALPGGSARRRNGLPLFGPEPRESRVAGRGLGANIVIPGGFAHVPAGEAKGEFGAAPGRRTGMTMLRGCCALLGDKHRRERHLGAFPV